MTNNSFGNGAKINIKVSNSSSNKDNLVKKQEVLLHIDPDENKVDISEMPPPPPSPVSEMFTLEALSIQLVQEKQKNVEKKNHSLAILNIWLEMVH